MLITAVRIHQPQLHVGCRVRCSAKNQLPAVGGPGNAASAPPLAAKKVSCVTSVPSGFIVKTSPDAPVKAILPFLPGKVACNWPDNTSSSKMLKLARVVPLPIPSNFIFAPRGVSLLESDVCPNCDLSNPGSPAWAATFAESSHRPGTMAEASDCSGFGVNWTLAGFVMIWKALLYQVIIRFSELLRCLMFVCGKLPPIGGGFLCKSQPMDHASALGYSKPISQRVSSIAAVFWFTFRINLFKFSPCSWKGRGK